VRELREIIYLIEQADADVPLAVEHPIVETHSPSLDVSGRLADIVFKMRAYSEPLTESVQDDSYSTGVEAGLEMAAEMLENLIRELDGQQ
jgi:hypothetical protein